MAPSYPTRDSLLTLILAKYVFDPESGEQIPILGEVISWEVEPETLMTTYQVVYEDGDTADLYYNELMAAVCPDFQ